MGPLACVEVRALPLQLLLHAHPDWCSLPVVALTHEKPTGVILHANDRALAKRILPGMRFATALSMERALRGGAVPETAIEKAVKDLAQHLWQFGPAIEPSKTEPGVFWVDVSGLRVLFPALDMWARDVSRGLSGKGFSCVVAVGFSKFGTYATAKANKKNCVFQNPQDERNFVTQVNIEHVVRDVRFRDRLLRLNVRTLGELLRLSGDGLYRRFGAEAKTLYELASCEGWDALDPATLHEPINRRETLDYPEDNCQRLVFPFASLLQTLLAELQRRHEMLQTLCFTLVLGDGREYTGEIVPAVPTRDATQVLTLLRLRLESLSLTASVMEIKACAKGVAVAYEQLGLYQATASCNIDAAQRFYAKIRAKRGSDSVVVAQIEDGQLPEAQYTWKPLQNIVAPDAINVTTAPLVRVIFSPAIALQDRNRRDPDGWLIAGISEGPIEEVVGPHDICGGWWNTEIRRAYYYVRTRSGRWLWIYRDNIRRQWFLQGEIQ